MPSWNIHTAHVEHLVEAHDPSELGIRDVNCFLFGNYVPDIYVGYMVEGPSQIIDYRKTHFADPRQMPEPDFDEFWQRFGLPSADADGHVSDVVLGAWTHLMADCIYNRHVNEWIRERGLVYGDPLRVRKQGDFDRFGHTLDISLVAEVTPELIAQCAAFPQYSVAERDVRAAVEVAEGIVADTRTHHIEGIPTYSLLTPGFFDEVGAEVERTMASSLLAYASRA